MNATYLAADDIAYRAGYLVAAIGIPLVGLILLIVGLKQRSRRRLRPGPYAPPYPPPYPPPPGYPPNAGYPAPPPPPGAYPGYPVGYPPPRTGSSGTALIAIGVVLLLLGGLGILGRAAVVSSKKPSSASSAGSSTQATPSAQASPSSKPPSLQVGGCISESSFRTGSVSSGPFDCTDPALNYELASRGGRGDACPDGKSHGSVYDRLNGESETLCFLPNLKQGQCYSTTDSGPAETVTLADCADTTRARLRVDKRVDGSTDTTQCAPGTKGIDFPSPARLYCLETLGP